MKSSIPKYISIIAASLLVLLAVTLYLNLSEDTIDVQQSKEAPPLQPVSIATLSANPETVKVSTFAEVRPRWSAEIRAAVSGRILEVLDSALAGEKVKAGTTLITIENSQYAAELSAAKLAVKVTQLDLLRAEKATQIVRNQYKQNGTKPPNDLALHLPELGIAKTAVKSAKARVEASRQTLQDTTIKAPFSGFITERFVSPGQSVNIGDVLAKLVDDKRFELVAEVGRPDWLLLQQPLSGLTADVLNQDGTLITQAIIRQGGGFLDENTRQFKIFLDIKNQDHAKVLSGDFVQVLLPGITVQKALNIPETALTQEGYMWFLDKEDRLQYETPNALFRRQNRIIIRAPKGADTWRIAITPLAFFLPGQKVHPQPVKN